MTEISAVPAYNPYQEFKARMFKIRPDIMDFSGAANITSDKSLYYDKQHYRAVVAERIMGSVFAK